MTRPVVASIVVVLGVVYLGTHSKADRTSTVLVDEKLKALHGGECGQFCEVISACAAPEDTCDDQDEVCKNVNEQCVQGGPFEFPATWQKGTGAEECEGNSGTFFCNNITMEYLLCLEIGDCMCRLRQGEEECVPENQDWTSTYPIKHCFDDNVCTGTIHVP